MTHDPLAKPECTYCGKTITAQQRIHPGHCGAQACFEHHIIKGARIRREQKAQAYRDQIAAARALAAPQISEAAQGLGAGADLPEVVVVPHQDTPITALPDARRAAFAAHLDGITQAAFDAGETGPASAGFPPAAFPTPAPLPPSMVAEGCGLCQGLCCRTGGGDRHAFLTQVTILRLRRDRPDLSREAVVETYLSHLPDRSVEGSCVFHGAQGCTQPRDWRDDTCNTFHCADLHHMRDVAGVDGSTPVVMVAMLDGQPQKVGLYTPASSTATRGANPRDTDA